MSHFNDNIFVENHGNINALILPSLSQVTSLNGTYTMLGTDPTSLVLTGTASGFSVLLPNATSEPQGHLVNIYNTTSQIINIKDGAGNLLTSLSQSSVAYAYLQTNGTAAGTWIIWQVLISSTASGVINYNMVSSTAFTTSSTTNVVITAFSVTPQAGTYAIWYNAESFYTTTPKSHWFSIYKAGVQISNSERSQDTAHSNQNMNDSTMTITQVNGSQAIDVRVRCDNTGSLTVNKRSLLLIRLGT